MDTDTRITQPYNVGLPPIVQRHRNFARRCYEKLVARAVSMGAAVFTRGNAVHEEKAFGIERLRAAV